MNKPENETTAASALLTDHPAPKHAPAMSPGLAINTIFCPEDVADPFSTVQWEKRTAQIKGEGGEVFFEQHDCEVPSTWSQLATNVVASKYLYGEVGTPERETGARQLIHRVCRTISDWGLGDGYFADKADGERFYRELVYLCLHQYASFNSPTHSLPVARCPLPVAFLRGSRP